MTVVEGSKCQVLIFAEEDKLLGHALQQQLTDGAWWVEYCTRFEDVLTWVFQHRHHPPDVVLIDVPATRSSESMNAFKAYGYLRNGGWVAALGQRFAGWGEEVPIFMLIDLEQRFEVEERMYTLGVQPDRIDYKPYHPQNLLNKLNTLTKRGTAVHHVTEESATLRVRSLVVDTAQERVLLAGEQLKLSQLEYRLLHYLTSRLDLPLTREQLLADIWGITGVDALNNRNVDVYIGKLRKKLINSDCADLIERGRNGTYLLKSTPLYTDHTLPEKVTNEVPTAPRQPVNTARLIRESQEPHLPKTITLQDNTAHSLRVGLKIGRNSQQCEIVLHDQRISRLHATIFAAQGQFYLRDERSTGHTYLKHKGEQNTEPNQLIPHTAVPLTDGDLVCFNTVAYRFDFV